MQIARKVFHMSGGLVAVAYQASGVGRLEAGLCLWGAALALAGIDLWRGRSSRVEEVFQRLFGRLAEAKDARGLNTSTWYLAGCAATVSLFTAPEACAGILCLALGDPLAAIVGSRVRSPRVGKVSLAGSSTCLAAATLACLAYAPWPQALAAGAAATLLEAASGSKLDNLSMPLGAALVLQLL